MNALFNTIKHLFVETNDTCDINGTCCESNDTNEVNDPETLKQIWTQHMGDTLPKYNNNLKLDSFHSWLGWWYSPKTVLLMYQSLLVDIELAKNYTECYIDISNYMVSVITLFKDSFKHRKFISCYNNSMNRLLKSSKQFEMDDEMYKQFVYTVTNNTANINSMLNKI